MKIARTFDRILLLNRFSKPSFQPIGHERIWRERAPVSLGAQDGRVSFGRAAAGMDAWTNMPSDSGRVESIGKYGKREAAHVMKEKIL